MHGCVGAYVCDITACVVCYQLRMRSLCSLTTLGYFFISLCSPSSPRYLRFWSGSSMNPRSLSRQSRMTLLLLISPARSVLTHSYSRLLAGVVVMMSHSGSVSFLASRGSSGERLPSSLTTLMSTLAKQPRKTRQTRSTVADR